MTPKIIYYKPQVSFGLRVERGIVLYEGKTDNDPYYLVQYSQHSSPEIVYESYLSTKESYDLFIRYEETKLHIEEAQNDLIYIKKELQDSFKKDNQ